METNENEAKNNGTLQLREMLKKCQNIIAYTITLQKPTRTAQLKSQGFWQPWLGPVVRLKAWTYN